MKLTPSAQKLLDLIRDAGGSYCPGADAQTLPEVHRVGLVERLDQAVARCEEVLAHSTHEGLNTDFALMAKYRLSEAATVIQTLQRERDELRAALRPFAERAVGYEHLPAFETDARFQHLRRARLLLKEGGK